MVPARWSPERPLQHSDSTIMYNASVAQLRTDTRIFHTTRVPYYHGRAAQHLCRDVVTMRQHRPAGVLAVLSLLAKEQESAGCSSPQRASARAVSLPAVVRDARLLAVPAVASLA